MPRRLFVIANNDNGLSDAYRRLPYISISEMMSQKREHWFVVESEKEKQEFEAEQGGKHVLLLPDDVVAYWKSLSRLPHGAVLRLVSTWAASFPLFSSTFPSSSSLPPFPLSPSPPRFISPLPTTTFPVTPVKKIMVIGGPLNVAESMRLYFFEVGNHSTADFGAGLDWAKQSFWNDLVLDAKKKGIRFGAVVFDIGSESWLNTVIGSDMTSAITQVLADDCAVLLSYLDPRHPGQLLQKIYEDNGYPIVARFIFASQNEDVYNVHSKNKQWSRCLSSTQGLHEPHLPLLTVMPAQWVKREAAPVAEKDIYEFIEKRMIPMLEKQQTVTEKPQKTKSATEPIETKETKLQQREIGQSKEKRGIVYVASFKKGVKQPEAPPGVIRINVTSGSMNKIDGFPATQLSPMYLGPIKGAKIFENFWQFSKIFRELGHLNPDGTTTEKWEQFRRKGFAKETGERHPEGTKTDRVLRVETTSSGQMRNFYEYLRPVSSKYDGKMYDYIGSRKAVYVPEYAKLAQETPFFKALKRQVDDGQSVLILDFDGPRDGVMEVTVPKLVEKINDPSAPFGHGYVVAALLAGITPAEYTT